MTTFDLTSIAKRLENFVKWHDVLVDANGTVALYCYSVKHKAPSLNQLAYAKFKAHVEEHILPKGRQAVVLAHGREGYVWEYPLAAVPEKWEPSEQGVYQKLEFNELAQERTFVSALRLGPSEELIAPVAEAENEPTMVSGVQAVMTRLGCRSDSDNPTMHTLQRRLKPGQKIVITHDTMSLEV